MSNTFGYGMMNASAMVELARDWEPVPEQHLCTYSADINELKYGTPTGLVASDERGAFAAR